jgi:predicted DNA-binding protein (UPF0251 family)
MSPRPLKLRKISNPPIISGFKPYGNKKVNGKPETVFLQFEEYEALRLCDFNMLNHQQASVIMDVSRPTLTRIYARARQKIAEALVLGKQIVIEGGKVYFDSEWFSCKACGCYFNNPDKQEEIKECPLCKSKNISNYEQTLIEPEESMLRCNDICICPACGFEQQHQYGHPCKDETCPDCGKNMVRKGTPHSRNLK